MGKIITVNFRGDELYGFENDDGIFVALKPIVESMGMSWSGQFERVKRDAILAEGIRVMRTPFARGGDQEAICLKIDLINGWLFTIDDSRIKDEAVRDRVLLYKRECYSVLHRHFYRGGMEKPAERIELEDHEQAHESENVKLRMVTECRQVFGNRAAGQLWFQSGLPIVPAMIEEARHMTLFDYDAIKTAADTAATSKAA